MTNGTMHGQGGAVGAGARDLNDEAPAEDQREATGGGSRDCPLVVDMDGALLRTDVTFEGLVRGFFLKPVSTLLALRLLVRGRAHFKRALARLAPLDVGALPLREEFVAHLARERARGRALHLVSGADDEIVRQVADRVGLFDSAQGSANGANLKGVAKARVLQQRFKDFAYAGDSPADLDVWRHARSIMIVGASPQTARRARSLGKPVEQEFLDAPASLGLWVSALRLHQWAKNLLLFIPLLLSGNFREPEALIQCVLGFFILGLTASGTYIVNDLSDLAADRRHRSKRDRPFASGALRVYQGLLTGPLLITGSIAAAYALALPFGHAVVTYLVATLAYSLRLKTVPFLDVMLLAWLYTLRLLMGVVLAMSTASAWLLTFSMMFFFSLSLAKRHVEVVSAAPDGPEIVGRGYRPSDGPLTLAFGVASAVASLLIMTLYLMEEAFPSNVYTQPGALWLVLPIIGLWTMRIWLTAHRQELDDDPVVFAIRDPVSLALGGALALTFAAAVFG